MGGCQVSLHNPIVRIFIDKQSLENTNRICYLLIQDYYIENCRNCQDIIYVG